MLVTEEQKVGEVVLDMEVEAEGECDPVVLVVALGQDVDEEVVLCEILTVGLSVSVGEAVTEAVCDCERLLLGE